MSSCINDIKALAEDVVGDDAGGWVRGKGEVCRECLAVLM